MGALCSTCGTMRNANTVLVSQDFHGDENSCPAFLGYDTVQ
jgi:hypothetical protein